MGLYEGVSVLPQIFVTSIGRLEGPIFYRDRGHGAELGEGAPMLHVVAQGPGAPRGRPAKVKPGAPPPVVVAYALDAQGKWWSIRQEGGIARARTIAGAPYAKLGRRRVGWIPTLKDQARKALDAARLEWQRQRCSLI